MKQLKILIVDDDEDFAESLGEIFVDRNHSVVYCFGPFQGLNTFRENDFDICFLDVKMPGMNGCELFLEMKKLKPQSKVVLMTGFSLPQILETARDNGIYGIVNKPLDMSTIFQYLDDVKNEGVILIVDDDSDFSESIREVLEEKSHKVHVVFSGEEAVNVLNDNNYQLLILDIRLPKMNGYEVIRKLKSRGTLIPTIVVSGYHQDFKDERSKIDNNYIIDHLDKPIDIEKLIYNVDLAEV